MTRLKALFGMPTASLFATTCMIGMTAHASPAYSNGRVDHDTLAYELPFSSAMDVTGVQDSMDTVVQPATPAVGEAVGLTGISTATVTAVPEPGAVSTLLLGMLALVGVAQWTRVQVARKSDAAL